MYFDRLPQLSTDTREDVDLSFWKESPVDHTDRLAWLRRALAESQTSAAPRRTHGGFTDHTDGA